MNQISTAPNNAPGNNTAALPQAGIVSDVTQGLVQLAANLSAELWLNVQPGQPVLIRGEAPHAALMESIAEACRARGSGDVIIYTRDARALRQRLDSEDLAQLATPPAGLKEASERIVRERGALLRVVGEEDPALFNGLDPARSAALNNAEKSASADLTHAIMAGKINRCLLPWPTPGWASQVFPNVSKDQAFSQLSQVLADVCCLNAADPRKAFLEQDATLERRRKHLEALDLTGLRFEGPGTALNVGLSPLHKWLAGGKITSDERAIRYFANVPMGEIFTTPDCRTVSGTVAVTVPSIIHGVPVEGIKLRFHEGRLVEFSAESNEAQLAQLIARHPRASYLGEIALVGNDSPLAAIHYVFYSTLLDEKMRSHLAIGAAYLSALVDGDQLTSSQQERLGVNLSSCPVHHDVMISSPQVNVYGLRRDGSSTALLNGGAWDEPQEPAHP